MSMTYINSILIDSLFHSFLPNKKFSQKSEVASPQGIDLIFCDTERIQGKWERETNGGCRTNENSKTAGMKACSGSSSYPVLLPRTPLESIESSFSSCASLFDWKVVNLETRRMKWRGNDRGVIRKDKSFKKDEEEEKRSFISNAIPNNRHGEIQLRERNVSRTEFIEPSHCTPVVDRKTRTRRRRERKRTLSQPTTRQRKSPQNPSLLYLFELMDLSMRILFNIWFIHLQCFPPSQSSK